MSIESLIKNALTEDSLFNDIPQKEKETLTICANASSAIHLHRLSLGLTQSEYAKQFGISSQSLLSRWEKGGIKFTPKTLKRIAEICGCDPDFSQFDFQEKASPQTAPPQNHRYKMFSSRPNKYVGGRCYANLH